MSAAAPRSSRSRCSAFGQKQAALDRDAAGKNQFGAKFPAVEEAE
jgi:hypothetical protein